MKLAGWGFVLLGSAFAIAALVPIIEEAQTPSFDSSVWPYVFPWAFWAILAFLGALVALWGSGRRGGRT